MVVVGLPLSLDGSRGAGGARRPRPRPTRCGPARGAGTSTVELFDERLTTVTAHQALAAGGPRGSGAERAVVDQTAAAVMLTAWLERPPGDPDRDRTTDEGPGRGAPPASGPDRRAPFGRRREPMGRPPRSGADGDDGHGGRRASGGHAGPPPLADRRAGHRRARGWWWWSVATCGCTSEANPSGPPGAQVIVTVPSGAGVDQVAGTLEAKQVIGSSLAYRIWSQCHSIPGVQAGSYAFNGTTASAPSRTVICGRAQRLPPGHPARLHRGRGGHPGRAAARPRRDRLRRWPPAAPCTRPGSRWGSPTSTDSSGPAPTWSSPARPTASC